MSSQNPMTGRFSESTSPQSQKDNGTADVHTASNNNTLEHSHHSLSNSFSVTSISDETTNRRSINSNLPTSPLGSRLARLGRIRRRPSPHTRPRPEILTDFSSLSNEKRSSTLLSDESRNDNENQSKQSADSLTTKFHTSQLEKHNNTTGEPSPILRPNFDDLDQDVNDDATNTSAEQTMQQTLHEARTKNDRNLHEARMAVASIRLTRMYGSTALGNDVDSSSSRVSMNGSIQSLESTTLPSNARDIAVRNASSRKSRRAEKTPPEEKKLSSGAGFDSSLGMTHENFDDFTSPSSLRSVGSIEEFEKAVENLPSRLKHMSTDDCGKPLPKEKMLRRLDGTEPSSILTRQRANSIDRNLSDRSSRFEAGSRDGGSSSNGSSELENIGATDIKQAPIKPVVIQSIEVAAEQPDEINTIGSWFTYFMGSASNDENDNNHEDSDHNDGSFPASCGSPIPPSPDKSSPVKTPQTQLAASDANKNRSYSEVFQGHNQVDPVLSDWVNNKFMPQEDLPNDGTYRLGESRTVLVHEILRGDWTWCTAWSPDGNQLAIATENHHLAVVDTTSSSVWRVRHDRRIVGPPKQATTQSIRSIAWGDHFIAIGGIGNAVSILAPTEPYQILHTITSTGFVGSIDWLPGSNKLLVGSREGNATIHEIWENHDRIQNFRFPSTQAVREIQSKIIHTIDRRSAWVNSVQFRPGDTYFALGDSLGVLAVYSFEDTNMMELTNVANFKLEDSILNIQWSSDGAYLYAGGEDFAITVISTQYWEPVHKIKRERWVQFISSSQSSTHLAVGGVKSEVSILDVNNGWENIINISLKGLVPLSANWHPNDQYLVLTGQENSILAIETTNARHVSGHYLRSSYPILSIAFSPDGRMVVVGNEMGVVSIFLLLDTTFESVYEMVIDCSGSLSIQWSPNGSYVVIAAGNKVVVISRLETASKSTVPNTSRFFVAKVIKDVGPVNDISIDPTSRFLAVSDTKTRIFLATSDFKNILEMENGGTTLANSWSHDGKWFAAIGLDHSLVIYDTADTEFSRWQSVFTVKTEGAGLALAWGRSSLVGLQYCAYGGEDKKIHIVEIRTKERTWETVLAVPRDGEINDLDWNSDGLLAAAISNGTVTVLDLSYLQSGWAVNEMDYNWQRQALTCFTEIRRNRGKHSMKSVRWLPSEEESNNFLALGGTDGEIEIFDLTERDKCKGFQMK